MNRINLLLCLFGIVSATLVHNAAARLGGEGIVGGEVALEDEFPYAVSIQIRGTGQNMCTGGLLTENYVLTAAHCFINTDRLFNIENYFVVVGVSNLNNQFKGGNVVVQKIFVRSDYIPKSNRNDIAILKLKPWRHIPGMENIKVSTLRLPEAHYRVNERTAVIAGFGITGVGLEYDTKEKEVVEVNEQSDNRLHFTNIDIIPDFECIQRRLPRITYNSTFCGFAHQHDEDRPEGVCSGDSGAPLVAEKKYVVGIVSTSPLGCNESKNPALYTRVTSHLPFIRSILSDTYNPDARVLDVVKGIEIIPRPAGLSMHQQFPDFPLFAAFKLPFDNPYYRKSEDKN